MDFTGDMPITLIVKAPNQRIADQNVECTLSWTIRKLKEHLQHVYPNKPKHNQQKLIYSGKLLEDNLTLKQVLRQIDETSNHTVHLVCSLSADNIHVDDTQNNEKSSPTPSQTSLPSETNTTSDGLRYRGGSLPQSASTWSFQQNNPTQPNIYPNMSQMYPGMQQMYAQMYGQMPPQMYGQMPPQMYGQMPPQMYGQMPPQMYGQMPGAPQGYNQEQYNLMAQQMYAQYMTQYMQFYNNTTITPPPSPATPVNNDPAANINPANNQANRPANQNIRMNAQGGIVEDDDEENEQRDWLDCIYIFFRFLVLLSIVYFYSTFTRSAAVFLVFFLIYLLQKGWLMIKRAERRNADRTPPVNPNPVAPTETQDNTQDNTDGSNEGEESSETRSEDEVSAPPPPQPGVLATAWVFFTTFFSSLIPEQPGAVNQN
ncbi:homocysteine-responsive endoplasmic reticulum-resident ubiquitin-like domain member 2 protein [Patella vulgata]|uniref:homocysteine-responsive endoplasmic reticulum-resident ubiquitin-like domain member 2 protein n=1 Tax=Patella vulgata TaxID=6465 RepID=UPI00218053C1|nr:homocysteine-responsive endoplasmic reticulum-resident ubiquitin-like domain member 2 protein [Patella vulgata]